MYCSRCGAKGSGNFCSSCGARLAPPEAEPVPPPEPARDWRQECRYQTLLEIPAVRDLIAGHAAQAKKGMSADSFLDLCDKAFSPVPGVSLAKVSALLGPLYSRLGIQTGKSRSEVLRAPVGKVLVAALCSLARHGRALKQVQQGEDGCVLEATLPSDLRSSEGEVIVSVRRDGARTRVEAATKIPGQLWDWGKSKQCLAQLFDDLESLLD